MGRMPVESSDFSCIADLPIGRKRCEHSLEGDDSSEPGSDLSRDAVQRAENGHDGILRMRFDDANRRGCPGSVGRKTERLMCP
jgi:hypothetical protein